MKTNFLAAGAVVLLTAGFAAAQTTSAEGNDNSAGQQMYGAEWNQGVATGFFTDDTMGTLRSQEDVIAAWNKLSEADRTMVRDDCAAMVSGDQVSTTGAAGSNKEGDSGDNNQEPSGGRVGFSHENMTALCGMIQGY